MPASVSLTANASPPQAKPVAVPAPSVSRAGGAVAQLEDAGIEFEAVFLRQLMEEMLPEKAAFFGSGTGSKTFRGLFVDAVARQVATRGALGVREILRRDLARSYVEESPGPSPSSAALRRAELQTRLAREREAQGIDILITEKEES